MAPPYILLESTGMYCVCVPKWHSICNKNGFYYVNKLSIAIAIVIVVGRHMVVHDIGLYEKMTAEERNGKAVRTRLTFSA